jgi:hypothetical protein
VRTSVVQLPDLPARLCRSIDPMRILEFPDLTPQKQQSTAAAGTYQHVRQHLAIRATLAMLKTAVRARHPPTHESPLDPAHSLQLDPDRFAARRFDATVLECVRLRIHTVEIERHPKLLGIVRTAALGTQLQPLRTC